MKPENEKIYEKCVCCGKLTHVKIKDNIHIREYYIEGAGQHCKKCWESTDVLQLVHKNSSMH